MDIKYIVEKLIRTHETTCPFRIAKELKICIFYEELGNTLGYFSREYNIKVIHINQSLRNAERKLVCAHELGHAIIHPNIDTSFLKRHTFFSVDRIERQANTFLVELLLPDSLLKEYGEHSIYNLAKWVGVPEELVDLKTLK